MAGRKDHDLALFVAVVAGDLLGVEAALKAGADVERAEAHSGVGPLNWAARMGHAECALALMGAGANPWAPWGEKERCSVTCALNHGHWELARALVEGCPDPSMRTEGKLKEAFLHASLLLNVASMQYFLKLGVDLDAPESGLSSGPMAWANFLSVAAVTRKEDRLRALLDMGANPSAAYSRGGSSRGCAALTAIEHDWPEGVRILMAAGADVDGPNGPGGLAKAAVERGPRPGLVEILSILESAGGNLTRTGVGADLAGEAWKCRCPAMAFRARRRPRREEERSRRPQRARSSPALAEQGLGENGSRACPERQGAPRSRSGAAAWRAWRGA